MLYPDQENNLKLKSYLNTVNEEDARNAITRFKNGDINENQFAKILLPFIKRIIRSQWRKYPRLAAHNDASDFETTIWLLCRRWLIEKYDIDRPLSPVVIRLTVNALNDAVKAQKKRATIESIDDISVLMHLEKTRNLENKYSPINEGDDENIIDAISPSKINAINAMEKIYMLLEKRNKIDTSCSDPVDLPMETV